MFHNSINIPISGINPSSNSVISFLDAFRIKGSDFYKSQKDNGFRFTPSFQPIKAKGIRQYKPNTCSSIMFDLISKSDIKNLRFSTFTGPEGTPDNVFLAAKRLFINELKKLKLLNLWCYSIEWQKNKTIHTHAILDLVSQSEIKRVSKEKNSYVFLNKLWSKKLKFQLNQYNKEAKEEDKVKYDKNKIFHCKHLTLGKKDKFINECGKYETTKQGKKVSLESFIDDTVKYISKYMLKNASKGFAFTRKLFHYSTGLKINKYIVTGEELNSLDLVCHYSYIDKTTGELKEKRRLKYSTKNIDKLKILSGLQAIRKTLSGLQAKKKRTLSGNQADTIQTPPINEANTNQQVKEINLFDAPT